MSSSARVGINASIIGENPTGLGLYSIKIIRELDRLRDDLLVFSSCPEALGHLRARTVQVATVVRPEHGFRGHFARLLWLQSGLRVRAHRVGVMLNTVPEGILGFPIPQVTVAHDLVPIFFPQEYRRQQYYFRSLVSRALRSARIVVADSKNTKEDIIRIYGLAPDKVRVIYPGYDPSAYFFNGLHPSPDRQEKPYLLYVGNLLPHKNLLRLLDALAILRRRQPCRLIIRGQGRLNYVRTLRERIETLRLTGAVTFVGYTTEGALQDLYVQAAGFVLPSLYEGFGLPVLEAMACGTPVITSSSASLPEVAGDATLTVDAYDTVGLADAMYRVLTDSNLREDLRQRGLQHAGLFSWRRTAEQMSRVLDEIRLAP